MKIKKEHFYLFIFAVIAVLAVTLFYKTHKKHYVFQDITSYKDFMSEFKSYNDKTIVFFDIDDTIITADDSFIHGKYPLVFILRSILKYPKLIFRKNWEYYFSIIWQSLPWKLIDPKVIEFINYLKDKNILVLALTSMETGSFGIIPNMAEWRFELLNKFNIKFSEIGDVKFITLPTYRNNYPEIYKGIICCNQQPKGKVVKAFLKQLHLNPEEIVFFDDSKDNLESVAQVCQELNIKFTGYLLKSAKKEWNSSLSNIKFDYLLKNNIWLSDSQVGEPLKWLNDASSRRSFRAMADRHHACPT